MRRGLDDLEVVVVVARTQWDSRVHNTTLLHRAIFGADPRCAKSSTAAGIGLLNLGNLLARDRNRFAAMALFANEIPFWPRPDVATETVAAEPVHHVDKTAFVDGRGAFGNVEFEELPIARGRIPPWIVLDHYFRRHELDDGAGRVDTAGRGVRDCQRAFQIIQKIVDKEVAHARHVAEADKVGVRDFETGACLLRVCGVGERHTHEPDRAHQELG